ncbi:MAG: ATP-binding cassette domain-containing protein [Paludibacteraceae bacterium]|nr:ATP-binding cassette domain-containing protein [Paludibacteraceae bacterium]
MSSIRIIGGVTRHPLYRFNEPINIQINHHEQIAIVGRNASGKSLLVDTIVGRYPLLQNEVFFDFCGNNNNVYENVKYITFRDSYGDGEYLYYQQRFNSQDAEITPLVKDLLPNSSDKTLEKEIYTIFGIDSFIEKNIVALSSGELRKFQLAKSLLGNPRILIIDNPFIGLDYPTREQLKDLFEQLIAQFDLQIILVVSKDEDIPSFITHVIEVENRICKTKISADEYLNQANSTPERILSTEKRERILNLPCKLSDNKNRQIVKLNNVNIRYDNRTILHNLTWEIQCGEKWALSGNNGSGKSTLLSLICADNPQSYACDISLFGKKRGSGESIWDIKKRIGYVSPEMHRAFLKNIPAIEIIASGLKDTIGLYQKAKPEDIAASEWWLDVFGILHLKDRIFTQLSSGEQRLILLARAFVKNPDLIVLDEPMHGLDASNQRLAKDIIEAFCHQKDKTMIMVTHYESELPDCITHRLCLKKGHLEQVLNSLSLRRNNNFYLS